MASEKIPTLSFPFSSVFQQHILDGCLRSLIESVDRTLDRDKDIRVEAVFPPIPTRQFDYRAYRDGYEPGMPLGEGPTPEYAIADLKEQEAARG